MISIIFVIRLELGLIGPVSASSNILFRGLPSCLRPFVLCFSIMFGIFFLFILVACRSQFDFYLLSFSSFGSTLNSSKISSFLLWSAVFILLSEGPLSLPYRSIGRVSALYACILVDLWTVSGLKLLFKISSV